MLQGAVGPIICRFPYSTLKQIIDKKCEYLYIIYIFINVIMYIIRTNMDACNII